jgi:hypothetical protein
MLRFRLRTLLIVVAVLAVSCAWLGMAYRLVLERRAFWPNFNDHNFSLRVPTFIQRPDQADIPWIRRVMGDSPTVTLIYDPVHDEDGRQLRQVRKLFPEAHIWGWPNGKNLPEGIMPFDATRGLIF